MFRRTLVLIAAVLIPSASQAQPAPALGPMQTIGLPTTRFDVEDELRAARLIPSNPYAKLLLSEEAYRNARAKTDEALKAMEEADDVLKRMKEMVGYKRKPDFSFLFFASICFLIGGPLTFLGKEGLDRFLSEATILGFRSSCVYFYYQYTEYLIVFVSGLMFVGLGIIFFYF